MDSWRSWYISHYLRQSKKFSSFHPLIHCALCGCYAASMDVTLLLGCLYNGRPTLHMHPLMNWEWCEHIYGSLELMYITHHPWQVLEVCQFSSICAGPSLECCVASMDMTPLLGCLYSGISTSPMHTQMDWEGGVNTYMDDWSSWYITHHPWHKQEVSQVSCIYAGPSFGCYVATMDVAPCLIACAMVDHPHQYNHWWIDRIVNTWMDDWSLELMTSARSVLVFIHPCWSIRGVLSGQYGCDPLARFLI